MVLDGILTFFSEKINKINRSNSNEEHAEIHSFLRDNDDNGDADGENNLKELRAVEGTTLLHVIFAVRRDQELGREFVKYLKVIYFSL